MGRENIPQEMLKRIERIDQGIDLVKKLKESIISQPKSKRGALLDSAQQEIEEIIGMINDCYGKEGAPSKKDLDWCKDLYEKSLVLVKEMIERLPNYAQPIDVGRIN